jgi:hypothetical protein
MFGGGKTGGKRSLGVLSSLLFNLSLFAMPLAAVNAWQALQDSSVYNYAATDASKARTRAALERAAGALIPPSASDRKTYWSSLVRRELDGHDRAAARGLVLCAHAMLDPANAGRLAAQLPADADDATRLQSALVFLNDDVRGKFQTAAGAPQAGAMPSEFFQLGDLSGLAAASDAWRQDPRTDSLDLRLKGAGLALTATGSAANGRVSPLKAGASVIQAARRAGALTPQFTAHMQARLSAALPAAALKTTLDKAFAPSKTAPSDEAIARAFQSAADPAALNFLTGELADVTAIANAVTPEGAVRLLSDAQSGADLAKLRLIAEAGGDRALAVAKRADRAALLGAAKGALQMNTRLWFDFGALGVSLFVFALSLFATLAQALLLEWRHGAPEEEDDEDFAHA